MRDWLWLEVKRLLPPVPAKRVWGLAGLILPMLALSLLPSSVLDLLTLNVTEPRLGAFWGAHFIHLTMQHLLMNVAGFTVIWLLTVAFVPLRWVFGLTLLLPPMVSALLIYSSDNDAIASYRGFSGILYGYWICGIVWSWSQQRLVALGCLVVMIGKIAVEQRPDFDLGYLQNSIGGLVAVDAHLWGAVAGAMLTAAFVAIDKIREQKVSSEQA